MADTTSNNVASLVSPDILANLKTSQQPKAFGDQLLKTGLNAGSNIALNSTISKLYKEKTDLITEGIQLDNNHQLKLQQLQAQNTSTKTDVPPPLNDEEYKVAVAIEDVNYEAAKKNLDERKEKNKNNIDNYLKDPFAKQKEQLKKRKEVRTKAKQKVNQEKQASKKQKRDAVLKNAKKTIVPILTLLLTDKITDIISQNDTIKKLVDDTNKIIEEANISNDPTKLNNAKIARDNAVKVIQSNEDKITKINEQIQRIILYINIFDIIINKIGPVILSIPLPSPAPDIVTIPKETFRRKVYEPAIKILNSLSALLPTILVSLQKAIQILEDYKAQLLAVNNVLDNNVSNLTPMNITFGSTDYGSYKGFKFALREENNPKLIIQGNKRHYAVAIDTNNVEVLKSELSFTLDPNDLIEQLKLVIDRENLIA